ncbi:ion channel [Oceaniglobus indicus]|uniref:ion channel n=1 Tax=Oceaniglobus indicus TaxID=2047749 RepID=UPI000C17524D|nr:transporter substrate-binding domain-containing protein [Oceaniglobus indicus]
MPSVARILSCLAFFIALSLAPVLSASAQSAPDPAQGGEPERLRVGVEHLPPFAVNMGDGASLGLAMDIWRLAAERLDLDWTTVPLEPGTATDALLADRIDVALPINATPERAQAVDLTQPIYTATMGIATTRDPLLSNLLFAFLSLEFLAVVLWLSALLFAVGALVWLFERKKNHEQFGGGRTLDGLGDGFWWAGVTLTTIGYGDKAPITLPGRAVAMLWMLVGLAVSSALTASIVTLTDANRGAHLPEDFVGRSVAVVEDSTAELYLADKRAELHPYVTIEEALQALDAGIVERVAFNAPALRAAIDRLDYTDLHVVTTRYDPHYVTMALPADSGLRAPLDATVLAILSSETGWTLIDRYLPE